LENHFAGFMGQNLALNKYSDSRRWLNGDLGWRQYLHFFSDNNSCLRRSAWEKFPYADVKFGEDQLWANAIIEAGLTKVYSPFAIVYHSHDYTPDQWYKRATEEAEFFLEHFGYKVYNGDIDFLSQLAVKNASDERWGVQKRLTADEIESRKLINEAILRAQRDVTLSNDPRFMARKRGLSRILSGFVFSG
jgi:hypothetical protein